MGARDIVTNLIANDKASKPLKDAGKAAESAADSFNELSAAEARAALAAEKAAVRVEKATASLSRAQERYGKESLQAREASIRLRTAQLDLADSSAKTADKVDDVADAAERAGSGFGKAFGAIGSVLPGLGRAAASLGAFGTVALSAAPAVIALGVHTALLGVKMAKFAGTVGPAAASLLPLAAGLALVKGTLIATGPAFKSSLEPVTKAFTDVQKPVGALATQGLPALSREFVRVNFPAIRSGMEYIAQSVNGIVTAVGKWINSTKGQHAIAAAVDNISEAFAQLAPDVTKLALAFLNLFGRTAGDTRAIDLLATALQRALTGATNFINGLTPAKIDAAWAALGRFAGEVRGFAGRVQAWGGAIMGAVDWWKAHAEQIQHVRDVLGAVTIAVGIATGGWIPALIAGVSLLVAHWDKVSAAMQAAKRWFAGTSESAGLARGVVDTLSRAVGDLSSWFTGKLLPALQRAGEAILPVLRDAFRQVSRSLEENKDIVKQVQGFLSYLGIVLTEAVIPALTWLIEKILPVVTRMFSDWLTVINKVVLPGLRIFTRLTIGFFGSLLDAAETAFGWMPGIGPALHEAAGKFRTFAAQVNAALSGIEDQRVSVTATIGYTTGKGTASGGTKVGFMARGGPVRGPGGPRDDRVPAMLSNGEFVVNARSTARNRTLLEAINARGYADGGLVVAASTGGLEATMAAQRRSLLAAAKRLMPDLMMSFGGSVSTAGARSLGRQMAAAFGWVGGQWAALERLWTGESGWNPRAKNPTSTAFGIPQFLKSTARAYGLAYGDTNAAHQIAAGLRYIRDAYGSPGRALSMWSSRHPHWYANGGVINEPVMGVGLRSGDRYGFAENGPETVVPGRPGMQAGGTTVVQQEITIQFPNYVGNRSELMDELQRLKAQGKLRALGVTG